MWLFLPGICICIVRGRGSGGREGGWFRILVPWNGVARWCGNSISFPQRGEGGTEREGSSLKKAEGGSIMLPLDRGAAVKAFYFSGVRICIAEMDTIPHSSYVQSDLPHGVVHNRQILLSKHHKMELAKTQTFNQIKPLSDDPSRFDCNSTSNWFASSNGIVSEHY